MKSQYVLHFHLFDGKTPLWWVTGEILDGYGRMSTGGFSNSGDAIRAAANL